MSKQVNKKSVIQKQKPTAIELMMKHARVELVKGPATPKQLLKTGGFPTSPTSPMLLALRRLQESKEVVPPDGPGGTWKLDKPEGRVKRFYRSKRKSSKPKNKPYSSIRQYIEKLVEKAVDKAVDKRIAELFE